MRPARVRNTWLDDELYPPSPYFGRGNQDTRSDSRDSDRSVSSTVSNLFD
ncbi:hypothetical protein Hanom_Chr17g01560551 [Helianthus anomalus]